MNGFTFILAFLLSAFSSEGVPVPRPLGEEIYFHHFSRERPNDPTELKTGEKLDQNINPDLPWKFFVHGWTTSPKISPWYHTGKAAYFQRGEYNIVFVDWSKASNQSYLESIASSMEIGKTFGKFIIHLSENGVSLDDIHLLGHSLGSHMVGFAGKYVRDNARKIGRITGLDPAGPFFESSALINKETTEKQDPRVVNKLKTMNPELFQVVQGEKFLVPEQFRLSKEDANFVDIIHTDATHFGILSSIGHCDFFPNGGKPLQPGCEATENDNCSHARSVEFFVESINSNNFFAKQCSSYEDFENSNCENYTSAVMGENTDHNTRGEFYLKTNSSPPFGIGDCQL